VFLAAICHVLTLAISKTKLRDSTGSLGLYIENPHIILRRKSKRNFTENAFRTCLHKCGVLELTEVQRRLQSAKIKILKAMDGSWLVNKVNGDIGTQLTVKN
jgi:hypothetical protein